jgi:hypothetical protein
MGGRGPPFSQMHVGSTGRRDRPRVVLFRAKKEGHGKSRALIGVKVN